DLDALEKRVRGALKDQPQSDPRVKAILDRVAKADEKIAGASKQWGVEQAEQRVTSTWSSIKGQTADWESEAVPAPSEKNFGELSLPKTTNALRMANYWLSNA